MTTLAKLFDDVAAGIGLGPPIDRESIDELRADLAAHLDELGARLPLGAPPLVLTKARIRDVLACEAGALASDAETSEMNHQLVLGNLVDRVAATYVVMGRVPDDPFACALESLRAERDERCLAWLDAAAPDDVADLREELEERTQRIAASWPRVEGTWWPRPEDRATIAFAGGRLLLSGRFDLVVGGRPTPMERVIVEVKAGVATGVHQPDLYWYALLGALRDRMAPRVVAVWSAGDGTTVTAPISAGALESAARRVVAAATRWIELGAGRAPEVTGHQGCRWCPALETCATGQAWSPDA